MAVPWLRRLVPGLSPLRAGFDLRPVHVSCVAGKVALGQVFLLVLRYSPVSYIPPMLHTYQTAMVFVPRNRGVLDRQEL